MWSFTDSVHSILTVYSTCTYNSS